MDRAILSMLEGAVTRNESDGVTDQNATAFRGDGTTYLPCKTFTVATTSSGESLPFVTIMLDHGEAGLFQSLTSEGARETAAALIDLADEIERQVGEQVRVGIDKARGK